MTNFFRDRDNTLININHISLIEPIIQYSNCYGYVIILQSGKRIEYNFKSLNAEADCRNDYNRLMNKIGELGGN